MTAFAFHRLYIHACGILLSWMLSAPMPCSSSHPPYRYSKESTYYDESISVATPVSIRQHRTLHSNDYCSLCQGRDILSDKEILPGKTCSDIDNFYRFEWNASPNLPGTCRAEIKYNNFSELCCKTSIPRYECEENVHDLLFGTRAIKRYNSIVPPIVGMDKPLDVSVRVRYDAMQDIDMGRSQVAFNVKLQLMWDDPRLVWNVTDNDTCSNLIDVFTGYDVETTMIWLPDFDLRNQIHGIQSMPRSKASLHSDGSVLWRIDGVLKAYCAFSGLANIPYDTMGCQLLFGGMSRISSKLVNYVLAYPDQFFTGSFDVTYRDWQFLPEMTTQGKTLGDNFIYYNFYFQRPKKHYIDNIVIPTIVFTYLSFLTFCLDVRIGERLGFGMALTLVIVAQKLITVDLSPISNERLWLDKFVGWSFYFVIISVAESILIAFLYFIRKDRKKEDAKRINDLDDENNSDVRGGPRDNEEPYNEGNGIANEKIGVADENHDSDDGAPRGEEKPKNEGKNIAEQTIENNSSFIMAFHSEKITTQIDCTDEKPLPSSSKITGFLYDVSLRRIDMTSLVTAIVVYTIFIIGMVASNYAGLWLKNEPQWFNEESPTFVKVFDSNDPNA